MSKRSIDMPFGRKNYMAMLVGIGLILLGFIIMSIDGEEFGFGFLGITLGPIVLFSGFMVEIAAIFIKDNSGNSGEAGLQEASASSVAEAKSPKSKKKNKR